MKKHSKPSKKDQSLEARTKYKGKNKMNDRGGGQRVDTNNNCTHSDGGC